MSDRVQYVGVFMTHDDLDEILRPTVGGRNRMLMEEQRDNI